MFFFEKKNQNLVAPGVQTWAMIEAARSMLRLEDIAATADSGRLACFVFGTNDLAKEMRATLAPDRQVFAGLLAMSVFNEPGNAVKGTIRVVGRMVELLHLAHARQTVSLEAASRP